MDLGICVRDQPAAEVVRLGRLAEDHGFSHVFLPESAGPLPDGRLSGRSPYVNLAAMFQATSTVRGAVGVAAAPFRSLPHLAVSAATLQELSGGRFSLGVGVSHREAAARLGVAFPSSPLGWMEDCVEDLVERSRSGVAFGTDFEVLIGALGPKMVELGCRSGNGVVLNWLSPDHARRTVERARAAASSVGKETLVVLYVRLATREVARADAVAYDTMANYHRHFVSQELHDPDAIVGAATLAIEDPAMAKERLGEYAAAGIDVVCLYPHGLDSDARDRALVALAP